MFKEGNREVVGGLLLLAGSSAYLYGALQYRLGSAVRMGPGYFPMLLGVMGVLIAAAIVIRGIAMLRDEARDASGESPSIAFRPMIAVTASIVLFAVTIQWLGLIVAVAASVAAAAAGDRSSTVRGTLLLAAGLAAGCWFIFVVLLGLPVPVLAGLGR